MKFFRTEQIRQIDADTIKCEPIASIDLMERAAGKLTDAIQRQYGGKNLYFAIFAGAGNNGGDALAVARMLNACGEKVGVWLIAPGERLSPDCRVNLERLVATSVDVQICSDAFSSPVLPQATIIVDGLFGSGFSRPVTGVFADTIRFINSCSCDVVAIDIPSGLCGEKQFHAVEQCIVDANTTLTLQFPKLSLLLPENERFVGDWHILDIGLHSDAMDRQCSSFYYTQAEDIKALMKPRRKFSHKGDYGRALLVSGSLGMAGASILAARSSLRSGVGLLSVALPSCNNAMVQTAVPEAMTLPACGENCIAALPSSRVFNAIGIGPGLGTGKATERAVLKFIEECEVPMVLDADALNILARNPDYLQSLPEGSILTPHVGEFTRLTGRAADDYDRLMQVVAFAREHRVCVVLKGAHTAVCSPDGECFFNSTGNPGMATGGSGDVLTGVALALLARGYNSIEAARIAVYVHGVAGDIACQQYGETALTAGDIVNALPSAWKGLGY